MTFKRVRLRPGRAIVNVGFAAAVIFLSACSGGEEDTNPKPVDNLPSAPIETPTSTVTLPAVWNTEPLHAPVTDMAFVGGPEPVMLALFADGTAQMFDLNAERLTEPAELDVEMVTSGRTITLGGTALSVFPALSEDGAPKLVVFNPILSAPSTIDLDDDVAAQGLCVAETAADGALFSIAYKELDETGTAHRNILVGEDETIAIAPVKQDAVTPPLVECEFGDWPIGETAFLRQGDTTAEIWLPPSYEPSVQTTNPSSNQRLLFRDGITVRATERPRAIAALSDVRFGGYPNGVIAITGPLDDPSDHRITFVEPGPLFSD